MLRHRKQQPNKKKQKIGNKTDKSNFPNRAKQKDEKKRVKKIQYLYSIRFYYYYLVVAAVAVMGLVSLGKKWIEIFYSLFIHCLSFLCVIVFVSLHALHWKRIRGWSLCLLFELKDAHSTLTLWLMISHFIQLCISFSMWVVFFLFCFFSYAFQLAGCLLMAWDFFSSRFRGFFSLLVRDAPSFLFVLVFFCE